MRVTDTLALSSNHHFGRDVRQQQKGVAPRMPSPGKQREAVSRDCSSGGTRKISGQAQQRAFFSMFCETAWHPEEAAPAESLRRLRGLHFPAASPGQGGFTLTWWTPGTH